MYKKIGDDSKPVMFGPNCFEIMNGILFIAQCDIIGWPRVMCALRKINMGYIVSTSHWPIVRGQFRSDSPLSVSLVING